MKQTILLTITFLSLSCSTNVGADVTDGLTASATQTSAAVTPETSTLVNPQSSPVPVDKSVLTDDSDGENTIIESPTAAPESESTSETAVELSKREEFVRLFVATVFAGKDAALEIFTIENAKWVLAYVTVSALLMRNVTAEFIRWFVELMKNLRAANTAPNA